MKKIWLSIVKEPYSNLPWLVWTYVILCVFLNGDNGVLTGHVIGFDDQVRMTQVLNWINGAGWYDRTIMRVNAPDGFTTIWSRIVDIPIAVIILAAQQFIPQKTAALVAAAIVPLIELAILFKAAPYFARPLVGKRKARLIILFIMFSSILNLKGFSISGFMVGQASHHPWYIILDLLMYGAAARLIMGSTSRSPVWIMGISIALLTAVGIEGYPMIAGAAAIITFVAWGFNRPTIARRGAVGFSLGFLGSAFLLPMHQPLSHIFYVSFAEPSIVGPILIATATLFLLIAYGAIKNLAPNKIYTAAILTVTTILIGVCLLLGFPDLLNGGAAGLSSLERHMALEAHPEGRPLHKDAHDFVEYIGLIAPILFALAAGLWASLRSRGRRRALSVCYLGFTTLSWGMSETYARYFHHAMTTSSAWLVWIWEKYKNNARDNSHGSLLVFLLFIMLGPFWMLLLPAAANNVPFASFVLMFPSPRPALCDPLTIAPYINSHYPSNTNLDVFLQSGDFLYTTDVHIDFLANYPSQNKFVDNFHFFANRNLEEARQIAVRHKIDLVVVCLYPFLYMEGVPSKLQTLYAQLQKGLPPPWLRRIDLGNIQTNYLLYEVDKDAVLNPSSQKDVYP